MSIIMSSGKTSTFLITNPNKFHHIKITNVSRAAKSGGGRLFRRVRMVNVCLASSMRP